MTQVEEWTKQVISELEQRAEAELNRISVKASLEHGADQLTLSKPDTIRVGAILADVQYESFLLGVRLAMEIMVESKKRVEAVQ